MRGITYPTEKRGQGIFQSAGQVIKRGIEPIAFKRLLSKSIASGKPMGASAGAFVVAIREDCNGPNLESLLVQKSHLVYPWPGQYMLGAAGMVKKGEKPADAVIREVWEGLACSMPPEKYESGIVRDPIALSKIPFNASPDLLRFEGYPFILQVKPELFEQMLTGFNRRDIRNVSRVFQAQLLYHTDIAIYLQRMLYELQPHFRLVIEDRERGHELLMALNRLLYMC